MELEIDGRIYSDCIGCGIKLGDQAFVCENDAYCSKTCRDKCDMEDEIPFAPFTEAEWVGVMNEVYPTSGADEAFVKAIAIVHKRSIGRSLIASAELEAVEFLIELRSRKAAR